MSLVLTLDLGTVSLDPTWRWQSLCMFLSSGGPMGRGDLSALDLWLLEGTHSPLEWPEPWGEAPGSREGPHQPRDVK